MWFTIPFSQRVTGQPPSIMPPESTPPTDTPVKDNIPQTKDTSSTRNHTSTTSSSTAPTSNTPTTETQASDNHSTYGQNLMYTPPGTQRRASLLQPQLSPSTQTKRLPPIVELQEPTVKQNRELPAHKPKEDLTSPKSVTAPQQLPQLSQLPFTQSSPVAQSPSASKAPSTPITIPPTSPSTIVKIRVHTFIYL